MPRGSFGHHPRSTPDRPPAGSAPRPREGGPRASLVSVALCALLRHRFALVENPSPHLDELARRYASFVSLNPSESARIRRCRRCGSYEITIPETGKETLTR